MDSTILSRRATACALCLALLFSLASCSKKEQAPGTASNTVNEIAAAPSARMPSPPPPPADSARAPMADMAVPEQKITAATPSQQMGSSAITYTDSERKFIRTANANFQVKDVYVAALGIEDTVGSHGGFVVKNEISTEKTSSQSHPIGDAKLMVLSEYAVKGHLIVRVPSAKTQEFLRAIVGHIVFLDHRNFDARDAQFDLLRQQLDALRNQETQQDIGHIVGEGGKLAQKADAIASRNDAKAARDAAMIAKKEFEDQVAFSTIDLTLYQPAKVVQSERVDVNAMYRQFRPGFFSRMLEETRSGWTGLLEFVLILVGIWPLLLVIGVVVYVILHVRRKRRIAAK